MSRITISFTRHDSDVVAKIKEIPDRDRSHVIVRILRHFWFSTETASQVPAPSPTSTPKPVPTEADRQRFRERFAPKKIPRSSSPQV